MPKLLVMEETNVSKTPDSTICDQNKIMHSNEKISVVIIGRNEERSVAGCIESTLDAIKGYNYEIIFVDSASTDNTIEIAKKYPINILQLKPTWFLSAAAGRYIGALYAKGKYIQFLDCDTKTYKEWFDHSIPYLEEHPEIAGVTGIITQEEYDNVIAKRWALAAKNVKFGEIDAFEGHILLRNDVLKEVGSFNPYLKAIEEGELGYRILASGYKMVRIPYEMSHHMGFLSETFFKMIRRKQHFAVPCGQIFRISLSKRKVLVMHWNDNKYIALFSTLMIYGVASLLVLLEGINIIFYSWLAGMMALFLYIVYEKSPAYAVNHFLGMLIRWPYFAKGFLMKTKNVSDYPTDVNIIK